MNEAWGSGEADHESAETGWNLVMVSTFSRKGVGSREDLLILVFFITFHFEIILDFQESYGNGINCSTAFIQFP